MNDSDSCPLCRLTLSNQGRGDNPAEQPESLDIPDWPAPNDAAGTSCAAARSLIMNFGLLLSQLPQVTESRNHYHAMLSLDSRQPVLVRLLRQLKSFVS